MIRKQNDEVIYTEDQVVQVKSSDIQWLKKQAEDNLRKRARLCTHTNTEDLLHEMFIVHANDTYIRPHKHPSKSESFHVIEGMVDVVLFDENGMISGVIRMGEYSSGRTFYYRVSDLFYHTLLIRSDVLVFHEITNGPFDRADTIFAGWAPEESDKKSCAAFMSELSSKIEAFVLPLL
jgi:cupin fold WbuC family metalloprotein